MNDQGSVEEFLDDRPELADAVAAVLDIDDQTDSWTFDDVPVDSGTFGELVSAGVVEKVDGEYRVADPDRARAALLSDDGDDAPGHRSAFDPSALDFDRPSIDRLTAAVGAAALAFVAFARTFHVGAIYRNGDVVLSGNDAYYYRYWVEQVVAESGSIADPGALRALPEAVQTGEPLFVATLWWLSELVGEGATAVGTVLAWYPVVSAVLTAGLLYLLAVRVTDDRRIAVAAVLVFALIPGHALRTSLGFADHHAFDYPWLVATALALVALAGVDRETLSEPRTWLLSVALGVVVAGQILSWEAGPLLAAALVVALVARTLLDVREGRSPLPAAGPVLAGLVVAAVLTVAVHVAVGWHEPATAYAPAALFAGGALALVAAIAVDRTTGDPRHLAAVDAVSAAVAVVVVRAVFPTFWTAVADRLAFLTTDAAIAETAGLFSTDSFGFLLLFGFALVLALPFMVWGVWRSGDDSRWLVATVYAWYFLALAALQVRFVGELAPFAALFAGVGLVRLAGWIDVAEPILGREDRADGPVPLRVPDRRTLGTLFVLFLLVGSLGAVQVPVKISQVVIEDDAYASAVAIEDHAEATGREYPENYVLSQWSRNRMYNYFVNGQSRSYDYAERTLPEFLASSDPDTWYDDFEGRVGYVVVPRGGDRAGANASGPTAKRTLGDRLGNRSASVDGVERFRALYVPSGGSRAAFAVVPGAVVTGTAAPNATVTLETDVTAGSASFTYQRRVTANASGEYAVRVPNPGTYQIEAGAETNSADVSQKAVQNGSRVSV